MSSADTYTRSIDYNEQQTNEGQVQGASMNIDFDNLANAYNANASRLDEIRRSDSTLSAPQLNNTIVSLNSLNADVLALITVFSTTDDPLSLVKGEWATATDYTRNDIITVTVTTNGINDQVTITVSDGIDTTTFVTSGTVQDSAEDITVTGTGGNTNQTETEIGVAAGLAEVGTYICLVDHTSGDFLADVASGFWFQFAGNSLTGVGIDIADEAAQQAAKLSGTSITSLAIAQGSKIFETQADKDFNAGTFLTITSDADPTKLMAGQVTSYVGTTLTVDVNAIGGAGTFADWTIQVSGRFGEDASPRTVVIVTDDLDVSAGFASNTFYQVRPVAEAQVTITIPDATTGGFIDGFEASFHLDLAGSILVTTPTTPPVTDIEGETDLVIGSEQSTVTLLISAATGDYQISQDSRPKEGTGLTLFATTFVDPIPGYIQAVTDNDDARYDDPSVTVVTPAISAVSRATADLTTQFMADAGAVSDLLNDDLVLTVSTNTTVGSNRDVQFFGALYLSVSPYGAANETLIDETANSGVVSLSASQQTLVFPDITLDIGASDRIVIKTFSWKTAAGGSDPTVDFAVGGKLPSDTPARVSIPQSVTTVSHNSTAGKQGGNGIDEFYHITASEHAAIGLGRTGFISGLTTGNNVTDAAKDIDIFAGSCRDDSDTEDMALGSTLIKQIDAVWAVGTNAGGLDTGAVAASTWYYVWLIKRTDTGVVDVLFSLSSSAPTMPANYDKKRLISVVLTDATPDIIAYTQQNGFFEWDTRQIDLIGGSSTIGALLTVSIPVIPVIANLVVWMGNSANVNALITSPSSVNITPTNDNSDLITAASAQNQKIYLLVPTVTGQIRHRVTSAPSSFTIVCRGFQLDRSAT